MRHRIDDHCSAAASHLLELLKFLKTHRSLLHLKSEVNGNLLQTLVGDGRQHAVRKRSDISIVLDTEEVG